MSPYRRGNLWWGRVALKDGTRHRVSLKTTDMDTAARMERMLESLADQHRWNTLAAIKSGDAELSEVWDAYARGASAEMEAELADGTRNIDLSPLVDEWKKAMAKKRRPSAAQQAKYVWQVRQFMPKGKVSARKDFTTPVLSKWLNNLSVSQPNRYQSALSRFAAFLIERGTLKDNPLAHVERAQESDPRVVSLWPEEAVRVLEALPEKDRPWQALMYGTGAEYGAIVRARLRDLNLDAGTFRAHGTKRASRDRIVLIRSEVALEILRAFIRRAHLLPDALLFRAPGSRTALDRLTKACEAAKVPRMTIHDWRHVFAVQAVRDGLPYHVIAHQLGHSNTIMVQKVYGRFRPDLRDLGVTGPEHPATQSLKMHVSDTLPNQRGA